MSIELMTLVWRSPIRGSTRRMVMLALADAANEDGVCWPSVDILMERVDAGRSTVIRLLGELESEGYIAKTRRRSKSTMYAISRERLTGAAKDVPKSEGPKSGRPKSGPSNIGTSQDETLEGPKSGLSKVSNWDRSKENPHRTIKEPSSSVRAPKRATQLPKSWTPNDEHRKRATELGLDVEDEAESFRLHADTHARTAKNWNAAFTTWLKKAPTFGPRGRGAQQPIAPASLTESAAKDWIRGEWNAGRTKPIQDRTGLTYRPPDLPFDVTTAEERSAFYTAKAREWIKTHSDEILARLTHRSAS